MKILAIFYKKSQVFDNFLTVNWQFSGGSDTSSSVSADRGEDIGQNKTSLGFKLLYILALMVDLPVMAHLEHWIRLAPNLSDANLA